MAGGGAVVVVEAGAGGAAAGGAIVVVCVGVDGTDPVESGAGVTWSRYAAAHFSTVAT